MKLRNKLFVATTGLFIVLLIAFSVTIYQLFAHEAYEREVNRLDQEATSMAHNWHEVDTSIPTDDLLRAYLPSNGAIRVVDQSFNMMTSVTAEGESALYRASLPEEEGRVVKRIEAVAGSSVSFVQQPLIWHDGEVVYVQFIERLDALDETLADLQIIIIVVTLIAIVPVAISGKLIADVVLDPIQSLIATMNRIKTSETFEELPLPDKQTNDELFTMSQTFNDMIRLLQTNFEKQEQFVSNASHELRTPITVIESYANLVKRRGLERPDVVEEAIDAIHSEAGRMNALTEQLLMLAKRDRDWELQVEAIDVSQIIRDAARHMQHIYDQDVVVQAESMMVKTDADKLKQLLYIVLDNALKYSEDVVTVTVEQVNGVVTFAIQDHGIGIPEAHQERIFDRFYRVDESRQRATGGSGLGLALAKELADVLDAVIDIESAPGHGTTVFIYLENTP
ncbi:signal transduction histidine kinase [Alkalibacillus flavidus]|uniref:histidine kinase n=1 Tax=Alkalibacillus flavidus TaxID=546021 RepID=A0ABV2KQT1_9BACI